MSAYTRPSPYPGGYRIDVNPISPTQERVTITLTSAGALNTDNLIASIPGRKSPQRLDLKNFVILTRYGQTTDGVLKFNEYNTNGESQGLVGGDSLGFPISNFNLEQGRQDFVYSLTPGRSLDLVYNDQGAASAGDIVKLSFVAETVTIP